MSIAKSCKLLGYSRSTFYEVIQNQKERQVQKTKVEKYILDFVQKIRSDLPRIGGKKLYYLINQQADRSQFKFGEKRFFEVLRNHNLLIKRNKRHVRTTDNCLWAKQYPNLVKEIIPTRPEQIWVSDITYFRTKDGFVYGHLITDAYSKKIMGAVLTDTLKASASLQALQQAIENRMYQDQLIHHSDRGLQYLSKIYTDLLNSYQIKISVTQDGNPYDNPVAERINGILKDEFDFGGIFENQREAEKVFNRAIELYNEMRPHWSNHLLTPNQMHQQSTLHIVTWEAKKQLKEEE